jgi:hypothetical protein
VANRLGFALQLGALRYLGFCPKDVVDAPKLVIEYVANQLGTPAGCLDEYGSRSQTLRPPSPWRRWTRQSGESGWPNGTRPSWRRTTRR